ncbi:CLUMA_CG013817, isoform A [Clunio marinus]|uniref:CLUMA_CG013817, isoform A n=1 Tax=Clunio marinus TaxID=568069 RepID=A0A1J1IJY1_9DIPT|nr:CLUMA_CG013817, isoform A [Clunio marinus]
MPWFMNIKVLDGNVQVFNKTFDLCDNKPKPTMITAHILAYAIPIVCPIKKDEKHCRNDSVIFKLNAIHEKMFELFSRYKRVKALINIERDTGITCIETFTSIN